jgi:hypothetical protein
LFLGNNLRNLKKLGILHFKNFVENFGWPILISPLIPKRKLGKLMDCFHSNFVATNPKLWVWELINPRNFPNGILKSSPRLR